MPVSVRLSELPQVSPSDLTNTDLFLITDAEATASKKVTLGQLKSNIFSGQSVASFDDVDITSVPPEDGQFLQWSEAAQTFVPGDISLSSLGELNDVDLQTSTPNNGQTLIWNNGKFEPGLIDLTPLYTLIGEPEGDTDLGFFVGGNHIEDGATIRGALQSLSNSLTAEASSRLSDVSTMSVTISDNKAAAEAAIAGLQNIIDNLEIDLSADTLNSINELSAALQDNPNIISEIQTNISNLQAEVNQNEADADAEDATLTGLINTEATTRAAEQLAQNNRLTTLETTVNNLDIGIAPETLNSINELAGALGDDADFLTTVNTSIQSNTTDISAIENILYKLVPEPPTTMAGMALTVNTNAGSQRLCTGFTDRTGGTSGYSAGDSIKRNTDGSITTNKISDIGPGDSGEISIEISQNSYDVSTTLATGTQVVDFMGLQITDNKDASQSTRDTGIPAGFYQTYDIQLVNAALQNETDGLHYVQYSHAGAQTQKAYFYEDESSPGTPTLNTSSIYLPTTPSLNHSSGIPHYNNTTDNDFTYSLIAQNLSGDMYSSHTLATSSQTSGFTHQGNKTYTDFGGSNPPAPNFGVGENKIASITQYPRDLHTQVSSNVFSNWTISTPYGSVSKRPSTIVTFNIMGNTARTNVVDEDNISVSGVGSGAGNAYRVGDGTGDNPVSDAQSWVSLATPATHEAIVVGGKLKNDRTDYSTGYYPVGPDLSDRSSDPQYAEFKFTRTGVSQFTITYSGSCSGCWVTMPGNSAWTNSLSGTNGWADMFQSYRGSGVPTTAEPGCSSGGVMDNNGGTFTCVFGTESSSNDTDNTILVRWKLSDGQTINSMSFTA